MWWREHRYSFLSKIQNQQGVFVVVCSIEGYITGSFHIWFGCLTFSFLVNALVYVVVINMAQSKYKETFFIQLISVFGQPFANMRLTSAEEQILHSAVWHLLYNASKAEFIRCVIGAKSDVVRDTPDYGQVLHNRVLGERIWCKFF